MIPPGSIRQECAPLQALQCFSDRVFTTSGGARRMGLICTEAAADETGVNLSFRRTSDAHLRSQSVARRTIDRGAARAAADSADVPGPRPRRLPTKSTSPTTPLGWWNRVQQFPEIREDRVEAVRRQIAAGTYETSDKLNIAVGRLLDEIG